MSSRDSRHAAELLLIEIEQKLGILEGSDVIEELGMEDELEDVKDKVWDIQRNLGAMDFQKFKEGNYE